MKFRALKCVGLGLALTISTMAGAVVGKPYSGLFVFGDSLTDAGNAYIETKGTADPAASEEDGFVGGRFSNGYNFADYLNIAITGSPSKALRDGGGSNFAVGGATAVYQPGETSPSFLAQIGYFDASKQTIGADDLVLVNFGGNDVRESLANPFSVDFSDTLADLHTGLTRLYDRGARNFVVIGLPDISDLPKTKVEAAKQPPFIEAAILSAADQRSTDLNTAFEDAAGDFAAEKNTNVTFFDLLDFEDKVKADPTGYGLPAGFPKADYCQKNGAAPCDGFLYFDDIHPTTQVHAAIADALVAKLGISAVPEPTTWATAILGFGLVGGAVRRRRGYALAA